MRQHSADHARWLQRREDLINESLIAFCCLARRKTDIVNEVLRQGGSRKMAV
jgi:hypothetical protein